MADDTDLRLPDDPDAALLLTPSGDLQRVTGRRNVHDALIRRLLTTAGSLLHRPSYGPSLALHVESPSTPTVRARLAADARRNLRRDPRVQDARVRVRPGIPGQPDANAVTVEVAADLRRDLGDASLSVSISE